MSRYNKCNECYNMKCVFVTGERQDFDTSECADFRPQTNADRIRGMSDEELAAWIEPHSTFCPKPSEKCDRNCEECILEWLKEPVKDGET